MNVELGTWINEYMKLRLNEAWDSHVRQDPGQKATQKAPLHG